MFSQHRQAGKRYLGPTAPTAPPCPRSAASTRN